MAAIANTPALACAIFVLFAATVMANQAQSSLVAALRSQAASAGLLVLRSQPENVVARTLATLDTNHDGQVDPSEVRAFAASHGLDEVAATQEFSGIDANGDGTLDAGELRAALGLEGQPEASNQTKQLASSAPPAPAAVLVDSEAPKLRLIGGHAARMDSAAAARAARTIVEQLTVQETQLAQARELDRQTAEFKAQADALSRRTAQRAAAAGAEAAKREKDRVLKSLDDLEDQARAAEMQAASLRAKMKAGMRRASELMASANSALVPGDAATATVPAVVAPAY